MPEAKYENGALYYFGSWAEQILGRLKLLMKFECFLYDNIIRKEEGSVNVEIDKGITIKNEMHAIGFEPKLKEQLKPKSNH